MSGSILTLMTLIAMDSGLSSESNSINTNEAKPITAVELSPQISSNACESSWIHLEFIFDKFGLKIEKSNVDLENSFCDNSGRDLQALLVLPEAQNLILPINLEPIGDDEIVLNIGQTFANQLPNKSEEQPITQETLFDFLYLDDSTEEIYVFKLDDGSLAVAIRTF